MRLNILVISDEPEVNSILPVVLRAWKGHEVHCEVSGFDLGGNEELREWLNIMDLFVIGLERRCEWGRRPEGVTVAKVLAERRKKVLIISSEVHSLGSSSEEYPACYWDLGSPSDIFQAISKVLESLHSQMGEILALEHFFAARLCGSSHRSFELKPPSKKVEVVAPG